jgi:hypothetical protein
VVTQGNAVRAYEEADSFLANGPTVEAIASFQLSDEAVSHVRSLLRKNSAGTLTSEEVDELDQCVHLDRLWSLIRAKASARQASWGA